MIDFLYRLRMLNTIAAQLSNFNTNKKLADNYKYFKILKYESEKSNIANFSIKIDSEIEIKVSLNIVIFKDSKELLSDKRINMYEIVIEDSVRHLNLTKDYENFSNLFFLPYEVSQAMNLLNSLYNFFHMGSDYDLIAKELRSNFRNYCGDINNLHLFYKLQDLQHWKKENTLLELPFFIENFDPYGTKQSST